MKEVYWQIKPKCYNEVRNKERTEGEKEKVRKEEKKEWKERMTEKSEKKEVQTTGTGITSIEEYPMEEHQKSYWYMRRADHWSGNEDQVHKYREKLRCSIRRSENWIKAHKNI